MRRAWLLAAALLLTPSAWAYDTNVTVTGHELPAELKDVGIKEHLGEKIDLGLTFTDEKGAIVPLGTYFQNDRPVLLAIVYYTCPGLCNYHLNGLTETMKKLKWSTGKDFQLVAVSMNHEETPDLAVKKKHNYLELYNRPEGSGGWHFLTGTKENIAALASQVGFSFKWLPEKKQFSHAAVAYVVTPEGKISRYLHGIQIEPSTLKLSLLEASNGKIGSVIDQAVMFCFQFNPVKNKYTLYAWNIMRIGAILTVLLIAVLLIPVWWRAQLQHRNRT